MGMRISETFFRQLLDDPRASDAVFALDRHWCAREGVTFDAPNFGLSEPEFAVHLCVVYLGEIFNGGHEQFFGNPVGRFALETLGALESVGLPSLQEVLRQACSVFEGALVPRDRDEREAAMETLSVAQRRQWSGLDRALYEAEGRPWDVLRDYLRQHERQVLAPERGLAAV